MSDPIDRQAAIEALQKALYEYEDKTERQFIEHDELDVSDWMVHRIFVQNMSDIDRKTILDLPAAEPRWIPVTERLPEETGIYPVWTARGFGNHLSTSYWDGKEWSLRVVAWMPKPKPWKGGER